MQALLDGVADHMVSDCLCFWVRRNQLTRVQLGTTTSDNS